MNHRCRVSQVRQFSCSGSSDLGGIGLLLLTCVGRTVGCVSVVENWVHVCGAGCGVIGVMMRCVDGCVYV